MIIAMVVVVNAVGGTCRKGCALLVVPVADKPGEMLDPEITASLPGNGSVATV